MASGADWTRDELILVLNLYFEIDYARNRNEGNERVETLARTLDSLQLRGTGGRAANLRTAGDITMKLSVFLRFDEGFEGIGLTRAGPDDEAVWKDFAGDSERLKRTAESIRQNASVLPMSGLEPESEEEFAVGRILTWIHKAREQSSTLNTTKRRLVLKQTGKLECEVCGFDFQEKYGPVGEDFAECHHVIPPDAIKASSNTRLTDLAIVCANCHRMLHRLMSRDAKLFSPADLKKIIKARQD